MFKLQRLEITGFKSFADHTEIVFTGDGITAIVGPNGCGKSNCAEAIAWVLGEQRVKHLRGAEMKDVIFQGTRNRPPSGMAEVVLHLVRDETIADEAAIDDIDHALEEIDEQRDAVEERFAEGNAAAAETGESAIDTNGATVADSSVATVNETLEPTEATRSDAPLPDESTEAGAVPTSLAPEAQTTKAHARGHWRARRLALEFAPGEVVSVTRRLYRSGESEYLLNGRACRLRDIQDLFSGTGLAGAHYAIIEQGRIGQILSAKPMDRRALVEEAASITKFRVRQRAAESRLEATRTNLRRVSDIISEVDKQVNSLRRQAAKARRYRQLREELRQYLRAVYAADRDALTALLDDLRQRLAEAAGEERALAEELTKAEERAKQATAAARESEEALARAREEAAQFTLQLDRRERERAYQQQQAATLAQQIDSARNELAAARERSLTLAAECEHLREREGELRAESDETTRELESVEAAYAQRIAEVLEAETEIEAARSALLTHTAVAERLMEIGRQLEAAIERLAQQIDGLAREGERAAAAHKAAQAEAANLKIEIDAASTRLLNLTAERAAAIEKVNQARQQNLQLTLEYTERREQAARVRHRYDTLLELDHRRARYSEAVQRIFALEPKESGEPRESREAGEAAVSIDSPGSSTPKDFHVIGTLTDLLQVEPQWEQAVESVLGDYLQAVLVPTPDDASRAALWLRTNAAGRATFLITGLHGASGENGAVFATDNSNTALAEVDELTNGNNTPSGPERIGDLLGAPTEILRIMKRVLPRETNAFICASLDDAMLRSLTTGEMCVTAEGEWVVGGSLLEVGSEQQAEASAGLLSFKRELRELENQVAELETEVIIAEQAMSESRARLSEAEDEVLSLNDAVGREEREQMARELNAQRLLQDIERAERHMRVVADDAARIAYEQQEVRARASAAAEEAEAAEAARQKAWEEVARASEALASARRQAEAESGRLGAERARAAAAAERRRSAATELRRMEAEVSELSARLERHTQELSEKELRVAELHRQIIDIEQQGEAMQSECAACQLRVEAAAQQLAERRALADSLAAEGSELHARAAAARDRRAVLEVNQAEAQARLVYLRETCQSELNQPLGDLTVEVAENFDLEAARAHVEELRGRVEGFGAVNMMALEELSEAEERLSFLTGQRQDIVDGITSTEEALREIKRRSRERFRHAFEEINRNFGELFIELFGGGRGEMSLIDADDILESGIDIIAQPPGKRLQNVLLLSGGEKAMAALALVLAVFRYRPAPFCLLDEVDAPLDEANIGRFATKIQEMAERTQFLVVTHNKRTMEIARALYGVTMEEAGVSKLVSVKFE